MDGGGGGGGAPAPVSVSLRYCAGCGARSPSLKKCGECASAHYCGVACQRADWPRHKLFCGASGLRVFWGDAHTSPTAAGEFIEVAVVGGELHVRGAGPRGCLAPFVSRNFSRIPTPAGEAIEGAVLQASSGHSKVEVVCWTRAAFYVLGPGRFRRYAPPAGAGVACVKLLSDKSFAVVLTNGDVYSWGEGKGSCHAQPDTRAGMAAPNDWEPFVACEAPMLLTSVMRAVPPGDRVVRVSLGSNFYAEFVTLRGARVRWVVTAAAEAAAVAAGGGAKRE